MHSSSYGEDMVCMGPEFRAEAEKIALDRVSSLWTEVGVRIVLEPLGRSQEVSRMEALLS